MDAVAESDLPRLFTPAQVAEAMHVSENYVLTQCRAGRWPHVRVARGAIRLSGEDFDRVVELCHAPVEAAESASLLTPLSQRRRRRRSA